MMDPLTMTLSGGTLLTLSVGAAYVLGWANKAFHVEVDPRVEKVLAALPGANCGGCGFVGCASYAEAVVQQGVAADKCPVGGESCALALADIMGLALGVRFPFRPVIHCRATFKERLHRKPYEGEPSCSAANLVAGVQGCTYGCLGMGDCVRSCAFDAIHVRDGLATVDYEKCTGCGACARVCPRNIITMVPFKRSRMLVVGCSNQDMGRDVKEVCTIGCIGCKACQKRSGDRIKMANNLPVIDYDTYDPETVDATQVAVEKCPVKNLIFVGKPTPKDQAEVRDQEAPVIVTADFKTTVDDTEWQG